MRLDRRAWLATAAALSVTAGFRRAAADPAPRPAPDPYETRDLTVDGASGFGLAKRFVLVLPRDRPEGASYPLVVLLHGLGEASDARLGAHAWVERYGLLDALGRLAAPPVVPRGKRGDLPAARATAITTALGQRAFGGLVLACPATPNVARHAAPAKSLDAFASWVTGELVDRCRKEAPLAEGDGAVALDGCSMGGAVALEIFRRRPRAFARLGLVQAAFGVPRAAHWANELASTMKDAGARPLHVLTSQGDPFRAANEALAAALKKNAVAVDLRVLPGPHDQPWLREAGTLEMLFWHERRAHDAQPKPAP